MYQKLKWKKNICQCALLHMAGTLWLDLVNSDPPSQKSRQQMLRLYCSPFPNLNTYNLKLWSWYVGRGCAPLGWVKIQNLVATWLVVHEELLTELITLGRRSGRHLIVAAKFPQESSTWRWLNFLHLWCQRRRRRWKWWWWWFPMPMSGFDQMQMLLAIVTQLK